MPPTLSTSRVTPIRACATSWAVRVKKVSEVERSNSMASLWLAWWAQHGVSISGWRSGSGGFRSATLHSSGLGFVNRNAILRKHDPWLCAARPVVCRWHQPGRIIQGSAADDPHLAGAHDVQPGATANPHAAVRADPAIADLAAAQDALDQPG